MKRLRNFMLRLIGMYVPFAMVILGIGACSYIYKDNFLDAFRQDTEEVIEEEPTFQDIVTEEVPMEEITPIEEEQPDAVEVEPTEEPLSTDAIPGIGECVCPDSSAGTLDSASEE